MNDSSPSSGHLLHNLVLFGRLLRQAGIDVHPGRMIDLVHALRFVEIGRREDFYHASRSLFVHKRDELPLFDKAFSLFWRLHGAGFATDLGSLLRQPTETPDTIFTAPSPQEGDEDEQIESNPESEDDVQDIVEVTRTFSARERLMHKDFGQMTSDELQAVKLLMAEMVWNLGHRKTRRFHPGRSARLDWRRSFRRNLRYGGEILTWSRRDPLTRPRPLIILADISGSMEQYSRLLLHFTYSLATALTQKVESFVFGTHLTRITRQLRHKDLTRALQEVSESVTDWSGGTRIGESLKTFNFEWGRRVLGHGAVVLIISDGWDRGDPALMGAETARLHRNCRRLVWLSPLLGSRSYEPLTRGLVATLPQIDDFMPVHNLSSLETLANHLALLDTRHSGHRLKLAKSRDVSEAAFISSG